MAENLQERIARYITRNVDKNLFISMEDAIRSGYAKAHYHAKEICSNTSPARLRAQTRRYAIDDALSGSLSAGMSSVQQTFPKGEHYVVIASGKVTISHIELHEREKARPAKHRKLLTLKNAILEPENFDLFKELPPKLDDTLHVVAVVVHPDPVAKQQSIPSDIIVTVPYTDWSGYHLELPLAQLISSYSEENNSGLVDEAWPTLKDELQKAEYGMKNKSG